MVTKKKFYFSTADSLHSHCTLLDRLNRTIVQKFFSSPLRAIALQIFLLHIIFFDFYSTALFFLCYFCFNFLNIEKIFFLSKVHQFFCSAFYDNFLDARLTPFIFTLKIAGIDENKHQKFRHVVCKCSKP